MSTPNAPVVTISHALHAEEGHLRQRSPAGRRHGHESLAKWLTEKGYATPPLGPTPDA